jgi:predicted  nucleic acid-binding Zn ribbon protein
MGEVISIDSKKPHLEGRAVCVKCKHEWEAVVPIGTLNLECPNCSLFYGRLMHAIIRKEDHWECICGNDLMHVTPNYYYCPCCGRDWPLADPVPNPAS